MTTKYESTTRRLKEISAKSRNIEGDSNQIIPGMVSVCMPNYNKDKYVRQAMMAIGQQTYKNIEFIIVDDASTDGSAESIADFVTCMPFEVILRILPRRCGVAWAQNNAYYLARGEYIANMDSDDMCDPTRIEKQVMAIRQENLDLIATNGRKWNKDPKTLLFGSCLFKREVLEQTGGLDKTYIGTEDYGFLEKVEQKGFKYGAIEEGLYLYRTNPTQRSKKFH